MKNVSVEPTEPVVLSFDLSATLTGDELAWLHACVGMTNFGALSGLYDALHKASTKYGLLEDSYKHQTWIKEHHQ